MDEEQRREMSLRKDWWRLNVTACFPLENILHDMQAFFRRKRQREINGKRKDESSVTEKSWLKIQSNCDFSAYYWFLVHDFVREGLLDEIMWERKWEIIFDPSLDP